MLRPAQHEMLKAIICVGVGGAGLTIQHIWILLDEGAGGLNHATSQGDCQEDLYSDDVGSK